MHIYPIPYDEDPPFTAETSVTVVGQEGRLLSAEDKRGLLHAWQHFLLSGFKRRFFSAPLYHFLVRHCHFRPHRDRTRFWRYYFNSDIKRLRSFLAQFGTDRRSAEQGHRRWLEDTAVDLKAAMCHTVAGLAAPLSQVLDDLEFKYEEMMAAWQAFARAADMPDRPLPPGYQISENSRNLLAYAAQIACSLGGRRPLTGLQLRFPTPVEESALVTITDEAIGSGP